MMMMMVFELGKKHGVSISCVPIQFDANVLVGQIVWQLIWIYLYSPISCSWTKLAVRNSYNCKFSRTFGVCDSKNVWLLVSVFLFLVWCMSNYVPHNVYSVSLVQVMICVTDQSKLTKCVGKKWFNFKKNRELNQLLSRQNLIFQSNSLLRTKKLWFLFPNFKT